MIGLNLHNIAGSALAFVNPWQDFTFTKTFTTWTLDSRKPQEVQETLTVQGKLQPANLQTLGEMGYTLREYQYWRVYLNLNATQIDKLRQLGCDTFVCNGNTYRITDKSDWQQNGWTEAYCYLDEAANSKPIYTAGEQLTFGDAETDGVTLSGNLDYGTESGHAALTPEACIEVYNNALPLYDDSGNVDHQEWELIAQQTSGGYKIVFATPIYLESFGMRLFSTNATATVTVLRPDGVSVRIEYQGDFFGKQIVREFNTGCSSITIELTPPSDKINAYIAGFEIKGATLNGN